MAHQWRERTIEADARSTTLDEDDRAGGPRRTILRDDLPTRQGDGRLSGAGGSDDRLGSCADDVIMRSPRISTAACGVGRHSRRGADCARPPVDTKSYMK